MEIVTIDNYICIISFVDIEIKLGLTESEILYTGVPKAKYLTSTMLKGVYGGRQKISVAAGANNLYNYWTTDDMRKKNNNASDAFHGQLIYIIDNS